MSKTSIISATIEAETMIKKALNNIYLAYNALAHVENDCDDSMFDEVESVAAKAYWIHHNLTELDDIINETMQAVRLKEDKTYMGLQADLNCIGCGVVFEGPYDMCDEDSICQDCEISPLTGYKEGYGTRNTSH
jgi:hypothetical protein